MKKIKDTTSLCSTCLREVPAKIFERESMVFMEKTCPEHGKAEVLIEKDCDIYRKLNDKRTDRRKRFNSLTITTTHRCNNRCAFCYLPERRIKDKPTKEIMEEISKFRGKYIRLSGGEPTIRKDLTEIIRYSKNEGKLTSILTNGIKLSDPEYVSKLESSGLYSVHLSFNSLNPETMRSIEGDNLEAKMSAIRNLQGSRIKTAMSFMVIRGKNHKEVPEVIRLCLRTPSIGELRIRGAVHIGRYRVSERIFLSELIGELARETGFDKKQLLIEYFIQDRIKRITGNTESLIPCTFNIALFRRKRPEILSDGIEPERFQRSRSKKLIFLFNLLKRRKLLTLSLLSKRIFGKIDKNQLNIYIRSLPDKHTIDLDNIGRCLTSQLTKDNKRLPFCYALVMNERDRNV